MGGKGSGRPKIYKTEEDRGTVFGVPFVITQDTDRVLIAKEIKEND